LTKLSNNRKNKRLLKKTTEKNLLHTTCGISNGDFLWREKLSARLVDATYEPFYQLNGNAIYQPIK